MTDKDKKDADKIYIDNTPIDGLLVTRCTKCKTELQHIVLTHNKEGVVAKVKCNTCGHDHKYYPEKKRLAAKKKKEETARLAKEKREAEKYARLMEQNQSKKTKSYNMSDDYSDNDVIDHKTFGKGIITKVNYQKMDVLFETGFRLLACSK